jgi:diacylglycerol kinase (ATP)
VQLAIIVNPISGTGGRPHIARQRVEQAAAFLRDRQLDGEVLVTQRAAHASELTREALARGARLIAAWGGDGTMNEVASVLAHTETPLALVPSGSGNGLARDLGIPLNPTEALALAIDGADRRIDAGEIDARLFFNVAGIGLDARVAHRFAVGGIVSRGFLRYARMTLQELFTYRPEEHAIATDAGTTRTRALVIAIANSRQYGNGAIIAPDARLDDGLLDVVVVDDRKAWEALLELPRLFSGGVTNVRGVTTQQSRHIEITSGSPVVYHVDGEPFVGGVSLIVASRPAALTVRVPHNRWQRSPQGICRASSRL